MILELARYLSWSELVPIVRAGPTGSFRSLSPRPPVPKRAFFVAMAGFSVKLVLACLRDPAPRAADPLSRATFVFGTQIHTWGSAPSFPGGILFISPGPFVGTLRVQPGASRERESGLRLREAWKRGRECASRGAELGVIPRPASVRFRPCSSEIPKNSLQAG
jgi:hypothetical protein